MLKPDILPGDELNQMLLDRVHESTHTDNKSSDTRKKSRNTVNYLLRAAAIALVVSCIGGIGVYAANYILKKTTVYEHGISVGNQEYNNDEALTEPAEEVTEIKDSSAPSITSCTIDGNKISEGWYNKKITLKLDINDEKKDGETQSGLYVNYWTGSNKSDIKTLRRRSERNLLFPAL